MQTRPYRHFGPMVIAALLIAGCGSSSSSSSTTSAPASTSPATSSSATSTSTPASTTAAGGTGVAVSIKHGKLGKPAKAYTFLGAGPKQLTVYVWDADTGSKSTCYGACATVWPPVTTTGMPQISGGVSSAMLGTTKRTDGTTQLTYNGHPLYYFAKDGDSGDAYGEGSKAFGAGWYVMMPNGHDIDLS
jgi:predicted lipoprotein with Yx(FWY)xxD motif